MANAIVGPLIQFEQIPHLGVFSMSRLQFSAQIGLLDEDEVAVLKLTFSAFQDSSIGDLVTHSVDF